MQTSRCCKTKKPCVEIAVNPQWNFIAYSHPGWAPGFKAPLKYQKCLDISGSNDCSDWPDAHHFTFRFYHFTDGNCRQFAPKPVAGAPVQKRQGPPLSRAAVLATIGLPAATVGVRAYDALYQQFNMTMNHLRCQRHMSAEY